MKQIKELYGEIFNIQRYSTHDGPGIRTTVFLKGCPLKCFWCQNPESQSIRPELLYSKKLCIGCGKCIDACPQKALSRDRVYIEMNRELCSRCGNCVRSCPQKARTLAGRSITVDALMKEVLKDVYTYENSGGGVTLSGGDPVFQHEFALAVLKRSHEELLHTAIETAGYVRWDVLRGLAEESDYIFFDMKCMDSQKHKAGTGVPNELILENAARIVKMGKDIHFRMPLIPGFNDDEKSITALKQYVEDVLELPVKQHVELLKYNKLAEDKFGQLDRLDEQKSMETQSDEKFEYLKSLLYD
ncbi:4-hydroxyphenylacetate decarboxylase activating enzyme [uncultured Roseburia sp.]|uniref:Glycyl-radical enzyme activating protein n=1 Tax=Brotonthovivens ammoniilytica TaxID=2981725 RepID=A0ABT2TFD6_9FIRM|nr:glycyl-radical enzyme activating protein [Brotonthovivens ammoniilytica]MCU6760851.1 glycyl-radical enzyme activating protein [Brotonthovivens ammoniilytica]SCI11195.1 4-hydroxyphenylacetate decarboxylase activating enzyme [uncultured Roseburia sp.]